MSDNYSVIRKASKTFSVASLFLPKSIRSDVWTLYEWCRQIDDLTDEGTAQGSLTEARSRLEEARQWTERALRSGGTGLPWPYSAIGRIARQYRIPHQVFYDLLEGMSWDLNSGIIDSNADLNRYCYQVAGTVGIMMARMMGVSDPRALACAQALGEGMQLTNMARDVKEDWERGRSYLPGLSQLSRDRVKGLEPLPRADVPAIFSEVNQILAQAESLYRKGLDGVRFLPVRCVLGILVAAYWYREIGREILRRGESSLWTRTVVPSHRKWMLFIKALGQWAIGLPSQVWAKLHNGRPMLEGRIP